MTGPPDAGKTTVERHIVSAAKEIGHGVLVLSPTNAYADRLTHELLDAGLLVARVYPSAREGTVKNQFSTDVRYHTSEVAQDTQPDDATEAYVLAMLDAVYDSKADMRLGGRDLSIQHYVLEETHKHPESRLKLNIRFRTEGDNAQYEGDAVEQWAFLAKCLADIRAGNFDWS
jgi:hypothetical protein